MQPVSRVATLCPVARGLLDRASVNPNSGWNQEPFDERAWRSARTLRAVIATAEQVFEETRSLALRCDRHDVVSYAPPGGDEAMLSVAGRGLTVRLRERSVVEVRRPSGRTMRLQPDVTGASLVDAHSGRAVELRPWLRQQISSLFL